MSETNGSNGSSRRPPESSYEDWYSYKKLVIKTLEEVQEKITELQKTTAQMTTAIALLEKQSSTETANLIERHKEISEQIKLLLKEVSEIHFEFAEKNDVVSLKKEIDIVIEKHHKLEKLAENIKLKVGLIVTVISIIVTSVINTIIKTLFGVPPTP